MNRNTLFNVVLFVLLATAVGGTWWYVEKTFFPPKPPPPPKPARETILALAGGSVARSEPALNWPSRYVPEQPKADTPVEPAKPAEPPKPAGPTEPFRLIALGGEGFNKRVLLSTKGAGVQQVILPAFDQATRLGKEAKDENGQPYPLELIPGYVRERDDATVMSDPEHHTLIPTPAGQTVSPAVSAFLSEPSYTLFHYPAPGDPDRLPDAPDKSHERYPSPELGTRTWKVVEEVAGSDGQNAKVVFETELAAPYHIRIRKTFELAHRDYHLRLKLEFVGLNGRPKDAKARPALRYQIAGARGLPIEGEWYTAAFRNAQVGWKTKSGTGKRDYQDASSVTIQHGGNTVEPQGNEFTYAAVTSQYFASALTIDPDTPPDQRKENLWDYVRATRQVSRGVPDDKSMLGDLTVRAVARPINPDPGQTIEHRYWVYDGPVKVRLLKHLELLENGKQQYTIDDATVDRYLDDLALYTMTDAASPNAMGRFADTIFWTDLVVFFTNLMHSVLGLLHRVVPVWGVDILILTVLVRLLLMVPSRRQQASMLKLQEKMAALKPEIDKLQEKYKGDPQRINQEKTRLMIQNGVNPLSSMGGCLLMFAQMPVFMGLYFCLQESIFFRLNSFLWIDNLAAPDMLLKWGEGIPWISSPDSIGGTLYLGPYLNILPILAVALMYINLKVSTPPPTDEQQEMQQKMMKFMMIFMGIFFYKMAAGMCLYFIVSTLWGLIERKLLKKKTQTPPDQPPTLITTAGPDKPTRPDKPSDPSTNGEGGFMARMKQKLAEAYEEAQKRAEAQRQIVNNPQQPPKGQPGPGGKKRRKKK